MSFSPERLLQALEDSLAGAEAPRPSGLCVAFSGGLDSTVLLAALHAARPRSGAALPLRAIHVDHSLHPDSPLWSAACREFAGRQGLPCLQVRVDGRPAPGESPEAAARRARYAAIAAELGDGEVLLTAHHADDQLETILLQWLRGGGLQAVAGMPARARFGPGWHVRPLLGFPRDELRRWAESQGLHWLEDPANRDTRFDRVYLRQVVLPALHGRWPAAARSIARVAGFASDALELERDTARADLGQVRCGVTLSLERLARLTDARQRAVLRAWLRAQSLPVPSARTLAALRHDMHEAAPDRIPEVTWPGVVVRRYRGHLYAERPVPHAAFDGEWRQPSHAGFELAGRGRLELVADVGRGIARSRLPDVLRVRTRFADAQFREDGSAHRRDLRKWFQMRGVLPWRRDTLPLLCADDEIVAIGDISCAEGYAARPDEPSWRIVWRHRPPLLERESCDGNWPGDPPID